MAENNEEKIILSVSADTSDAAKGIDDLKTKLDNVNNTPLDKPFKSFKAEIKEAVNDAKRLEEQFGRNSAEFATAAKRVAELKDKFGEFNQSIGAFNPDNKLQALVSVAKGATGAITGVTGAMQFLGVESGSATEAIAKLQGLMAFGDALNNVDDIKNAFTNLGSVIQSNSAYQAINNGLTSAASVIMKLFGVSVDTTSTSFKVLKGAIAATGIGLLVVAIGAVVENFDDLKEALGFSTKAQEQYNKTLEDFSKATTTATQKVNEVKTAFDLSRQGVITKKEALQKYNDTLGDAFGKTNDLVKAEQLVADKAEAYIQITGLKAQANALFALSAEQSSKALLASQEDQTGFLDKTKAYIAGYVNAGTGAAIAIEAQQQGVEKAVEKANKSAETLQKKGEELLKKAAELGKASGVDANVVDNKDNSAELKKAADEAKAKAEKAAAMLKDERQKLKEHQEALKQITEEGLRAVADTTLNAREKELVNVDRHYQEQENIVTKNYNEQVEIVKAQLKRKAISIEQYTQQILFIEQGVGDAVLALQEEQGAKKLEIEKKYNDLIADFINGYQETVYQQSRDKLIADFDEKIAIADEKQKELLEKLKEQEVSNLDNKETLRKETINSETNLVKTESSNVITDTDTPEQRIEKLQAVFDAEKEFRDAQFQEELAKLGSNEEEKALLRAKYDAANLNATKQLSEARKAIDKAEVAAKKENIQNVSNVLGNLSALVGKQTAAGKAFAIAQTTIDTYQSAMQAYKSLSGIPIVGPALGVIAAAAAIKTGFDSVKKITSVQIPGVGGGAGSASTPSFTAPQIESTALNPELTATRDVRVTNPNTQPIKAYLVDRDLQDHENKQTFYNNLGSV